VTELAILELPGVSREFYRITPKLAPTDGASPPASGGR